MKHLSSLPVALLVLTNITACPGHDTRFDDAIRQYIDQRESEAQALCNCYHLFLNPSDFNGGMYTSEEECLAFLEQPPYEDIADCMKSVLEASSQDTEENIETLSCYTADIKEQTDCYIQNSEECSQSACWSDVASTDECQGRLTDPEAAILHACAIK